MEHASRAGLERAERVCFLVRCDHDDNPGVMRVDGTQPDALQANDSQGVAGRSG
jgi:hypothetical protein